MAYKEAHRAFKLPPSIGGVQHTLDCLSRQLEMSTHELVAILKECQATKEYMAHLVELQQQLWDQVAAWGKQGEVKELVAGGGEWDESDGDDKDNKEDKEYFNTPPHVPMESMGTPCSNCSWSAHGVPMDSPRTPPVPI